MNPRTVKLVPALVVAVLLAGCAGTQSVQTGPAGSDSDYVAGNGSGGLIKSSARKTAPAVTGTTLTGSAFSLARQKGKVTVMNFWASWCSPCRAESPTLQKIYNQTKAQGVEFVGVDIKDGKDNALAFLRSFGVTYPSLFDQAGQVAVSFRDIPPNAVPSTLVIDRQGKVAARIIGGVTYAGLNSLVTRVAAEK